jgi:hypothetical protein
MVERAINKLVNTTWKEILCESRNVYIMTYTPSLCHA